MRYLSVCSGIEAASCAWHPLGWEPFAFSEIEAFPSAVLAYHYPDVPNLGDMTAFKEWPDAAIDVFVGGTPCQSFSVAGLRKGLDDPRGNLMLTYLAITARYRPRWMVWENVPGVLSSNGGRDFAAFLRGLDELGYGWAYRVLDAQYFGVAQRRRRVFVVGHPGNWRRAAAVLFERHSLQGHPAPRREAGKGIARPIAGGSQRGSGYRNDADTADNLIPFADVAPTLNAHFGDKRGLENQHINQGGGCSLPSVAMCLNAGAMGRKDAESETLIPTIGGGFDVAHSLRGEGFDASEDGTGRGTPLVPVSYAIQAGALRTNPASGPDGMGVQADRAYTLEARAEVQAVAVAYGIRTANTSSNGWGLQEEVTHTLDCAQGIAVAHPVAFHPTQDPISSTDGTTHAMGCGSSGGQASVAVLETLYNKGFNHGGLYASAQETNAGKILRTLREAVGEEAFAKWGLGILGSLQSPEILRQALHGLSIRPASFSRSWVVHCSLSRQEDGSGWLLQSLRETGCEGCPPQGWEPSEQLARQLGAYLSELSQPGAQASRFMRDLWWAAQGAGVLRQALSAAQEVGRPAHGQSQPAYGGMQVRRLTVEECEFLQGFPRGYTAIQWRGKPADQCPDGPRYKALGNSMAVPVMAWIGRRIGMVDSLANLDLGALGYPEKVA